MLPALPTGSAWMCGASPRTSAISKAAVFCPSIRMGFTEFTRAISGYSVVVFWTSSRQSSKLPRTWMISAPCMTAWASLPWAILPSGIRTEHLIPARVA